MAFDMDWARVEARKMFGGLGDVETRSCGRHGAMPFSVGIRKQNGMLKVWGRGDSWKEAVAAAAKVAPEALSWRSADAKHRSEVKKAGQQKKARRDWNKAGIERGVEL